MSNFKITKALIEAYVNNGYTVKMMADAITTASGVKCSTGTITHACKTYGVNLRHKKNPSHFVLEDVDAASSVPQGVDVTAAPASYAQVEEPTVSL